MKDEDLEDELFKGWPIRANLCDIVLKTTTSNGVLLEKLIITWLVNIFSTFSGT